MRIRFRRRLSCGATPEKGGEVFLDVPQPNREAAALAVAHGLTTVFEIARMYTGPVRPVALERVFGVTPFELG